MRQPIVSIIDDDESVRMALASLVRSMDIDARVFASAALFLSSNSLPVTQCVISDVAMPQMNGMEMYSILRQRGFVVPVLFITAHYSDALVELASSTDSVACIEKPFHAQAVETHLNTLLRR
ncbi:response regulator [Paraburkholderia sp. SIMBA_054]|uniref:response regulator n=1 Tax=Paraburkholderia sp. SIMBA_054 TaxID=3085795 RepID=UPI00397BAB04